MTARPLGYVAPRGLAPGSLARALVVGVSAFVGLEILALVLGLALVGRHGGGVVQPFDATVGRWWIGHRSHLVGASKVIAVLGDAPALGAISMCASAVLLVTARRAMLGLAPIVAYLGGEAIVFSTRLVIARPRPLTANYPAPHAIAGVHETSYSYPSGHATAAVAVIVALAVLAAGAWPRTGRLLAVVLVVGAAAVACSRLVLGVHWFSDVAIGMAIGITWGVVVARTLSGTAWPFGARQALPGAARARHARHAPRRARELS